MATTIYAARINPALTVPANPRTGGASKMPGSDTPPARLHRVDFHVLSKGQFPPSGPSHRGHRSPNFTRHL
ncbi:hypothetical protein Acr_19g0000720 [Actinidia rufa]|uniref:Uncharacterized protein n=1 Tax=Actinidia rufa TaxID=165716 RepID=A0A7J0G8K2_9ERIC|nr:hypothetical protein Acr_19g0000720 [Actinidia rufa]